MTRGGWNKPPTFKVRKRLPLYTHDLLRAGETRVLALHDLDGGISITNAAEEVVRDVAERGLLERGDRLIYRDTMGRFDELRVRVTRGGSLEFAGFAPIGATTIGEALAHVERTSHKS